MERRVSNPNLSPAPNSSFRCKVKLTPYAIVDQTSRVWSTDIMMADTNLTFTATIPVDIKPGTYILRQEVRPGPLPLLFPPCPTPTHTNPPPR